MATLKDNTVVTDPDTGQATTLVRGDPLPAWAVDQVGVHLVEAEEGDEVDDDGAVTSVGYSEQRMADLQKEVGRRNADRGADTQVKPEKRSIAAYSEALEADDARIAAAEADSGSGGPGGDGSGGGNPAGGE